MSSAYDHGLQALNEQLKATGKPPVLTRDAPENLEDDDLLEMVKAGLVLAGPSGQVLPAVLQARS